MEHTENELLDDGNHPNNIAEEEMSVSNISASASSRQMRGPAEPKKRKLNVQLTEGEKAEKRWLQLLDKGTNLIWLDTSGSKKEDYFANGTLRSTMQALSL